MKATYTLLFSLIITFFYTTDTYAQAFKKGAFLISVSGGDVKAQYNTYSNSFVKNDVSTTSTSKSTEWINGIRDPLIIEYGITDRIGLGFAAGGDLWKVNAAQFYGINAPEQEVNILTEEFTFDITYHTYVSRRVDWAVYSSIGTLAVGFNENFNGEEQNYYAQGHITRFGSSIRYYIFKRFAILGMVSHYSSKAKPKNAEKNNLASDYSTNIKGWAFEWGFSFRIGKSVWKKEDYFSQQKPSPTKE